MEKEGSERGRESSTEGGVEREVVVWEKQLISGNFDTHLRYTSNRNSELTVTFITDESKRDFLMRDFPTLRSSNHCKDGLLSSRANSVEIEQCSPSTSQEATDLDVFSLSKIGPHDTGSDSEVVTASTISGVYSTAGVPQKSDQTDLESQKIISAGSTGDRGLSLWRRVARKFFGKYRPTEDRDNETREDNASSAEIRSN